MWTFKDESCRVHKITSHKVQSAHVSIILLLMSIAYSMVQYSTVASDKIAFI